MIAIFCLVVGVALGLFINYHLPAQYSTYLAVAILATLDTICGGVLALFSKNFKMNVFISGLLCNAALAAAMVYVGNLIGVDLSIAAIVVFGTRIFQNFSTIRRNIIDKLDKKDNIKPSSDV